MATRSRIGHDEVVATGGETREVALGAVEGVAARPEERERAFIRNSGDLLNEDSTIVLTIALAGLSSQLDTDVMLEVERELLLSLAEACCGITPTLVGHDDLVVASREGGDVHVVLDVGREVDPVAVGILRLPQVRELALVAGDSEADASVVDAVARRVGDDTSDMDIGEDDCLSLLTAIDIGRVEILDGEDVGSFPDCRASRCP